MLQLANARLRRISSQPSKSILTVEEFLQLLDLRLGFVQETPGLRDIAGVERGLGAIQVGVHQVGRSLHVATQVQTAGGLRALQRLQAGANAGRAHADQGDTLADFLQLGATGTGGGRRLVLYGVLLDSLLRRGLLRYGVVWLP